MQTTTILWRRRDIPGGSRVQRAIAGAVNADTLAGTARAEAACTAACMHSDYSCDSAETETHRSEHQPVQTKRLQHVVLKSSLGFLFFRRFSESASSHPQSPKPISQFSDDCGPFSSFLTGSEGKGKSYWIAPVGGWELEFWSFFSFCFMCFS